MAGKPSQAGPRLPALSAACRVSRGLARSASRPGSTRRCLRSARVDARLLIVGLAPGLRGANRTGRPFTGDYAGDLLYATLKEYGFARGTFEARADDTLELVDARITNARALRAAGEQADAGRDQHLPRFSHSHHRRDARTCAPSSRSAASRMRPTVKALGAQRAATPFSHGGRAEIGALALFSSYHCSRYNTNTGVLTPDMFRAVFAAVRKHLDENGERRTSFAALKSQRHAASANVWRRRFC